MLMVGMRLDVARKENLYIVLIFPVAMISAAQCVMQLGADSYAEAVFMEALSALMELCECK